MPLRCGPCPFRSHSLITEPIPRRRAFSGHSGAPRGPVAMSESGWKNTAHPKIKQYSDAATGKPRYLVRYRKPSGGQTMKRGFATKKSAEQWLVETESKKMRAEFVEVSAG